MGGPSQGAKGLSVTKRTLNELLTHECIVTLNLTTKIAVVGSDNSSFSTPELCKAKEVFSPFPGQLMRMALYLFPPTFFCCGVGAKSK